MITDVKDITSFKWATVMLVNPLGIQLDGDTAPLALIPDSLVDPLELAVGDRVRVELSLRKVVIHGVANGGEGFESGDVVATARATARNGWMLCQGQSLLRSDYPRLFIAIGTVYGAVDSTHFSIPNYKGRVLVGLDTSQTEFDTLGELGGDKRLQSHNHLLSDSGDAHAFSWGNSGGANVRLAGAVATGGATAGNEATTIQNNWNQTRTSGAGNSQNLQPYAVANYQIKL